MAAEKIGLRAPNCSTRCLITRDGASPHPFLALHPPTDILEQRLELKELLRYLKAKALFDCREFRRSAANLILDRIFEYLTVTKHTHTQVLREHTQVLRDKMRLVEIGPEAIAVVEELHE